MDRRTASWRAAGRSDRGPLSSPAPRADAAHELKRRAGLSTARSGGAADRRRGGKLEGSMEARLETKGDGLKGRPLQGAHGRVRPSGRATAARIDQRKTTPTAARQKWNCPGALKSMT